MLNQMEKVMVKTDFREPISFGESVEFEAGRSLQLLRDIDSTVAAMTFQDKFFSFMGDYFEKFLPSVARVEGVIDVDGTIVPTFEKARDAVAKLHDLNLKKRTSAQDDHRLSDDDCVVDVYDEAIDAQARLVNTLNAFCWAIAEHDADLDDLMEGEYFSAEDFIKALRG